MDTLRPYLARVVAVLIASLATYLNSKYGFTMDGDSQAAVTTVTLMIFGLVYSVFHKSINSKINPVDAARIDTAATTKDHADQVTAQSKGN